MTSQKKLESFLPFDCFLKLATVKLAYNKHALDRAVLYVIAVIRYNHEGLWTKVTIWDQKLQHLRHSREFVVTVIAIIQFDCSSFH